MSSGLLQSSWRRLELKRVLTWLCKSLAVEGAMGCNVLFDMTATRCCISICFHRKIMKCVGLSQMKQNWCCQHEISVEKSKSQLLLSQGLDNLLQYRGNIGWKCGFNKSTLHLLTNNREIQPSCWKWRDWVKLKLSLECILEKNREHSWNRCLIQYSKYDGDDYFLSQPLCAS